MPPTHVIVFAALALGASSACHSSAAPGAAAGSAGAAGSGVGGSTGAAVALEAGAGASGSTDTDAQAPSDGGVSDGDPGSDGSATGAFGLDETALPFDIGAAETFLGQHLEPSREVIDTQTVEYLLVGSTITAQIDQTQWTTAGDAEFECQRAAGQGATLVVGSDYTMFAASDAMELARDVFCTRIRVVSGSVYSAALTKSFAEGVLGAY